MRQPGTLHEDEATIEFIPASITRPLNFREVFARDAPVEVDLGCGDGTFLIALATEKPQHNFLGIERLVGRVRGVCRRSTRWELRNVRVLCIDTTYAVVHLIPSAAVSRFHLLFPDPWPKRRHHRRRAVTVEFIEAIHRALLPNGLLHIATDHAEYFQDIERLTSPLFAFAPMHFAFPQSSFERRFTTRGLAIHRLLLRKISPMR